MRHRSSLGYEHYDARLSCRTAPPESAWAWANGMNVVAGDRHLYPLVVPVPRCLVHKSVHKTDWAVQQS
jgi:hypothetical protein